MKILNQMKKKHKFKTMKKIIFSLIIFGLFQMGYSQKKEWSYEAKDTALLKFRLLLMPIQQNQETVLVTRPFSMMLYGL